MPPFMRYVIKKRVEFTKKAHLVSKQRKKNVWGSSFVSESKAIALEKSGTPIHLNETMLAWLFSLDTHHYVTINC